MKNSKIEVLAKFLQVEVEDLTVTKYDENTFEIGKKEYMILTEEEAQEKAKEYILSSIWAFNADFIIEHSKVLDFDDASRSIIKAIQEQCESGNEAMKKLIDDIDEFIDDAISTDGRGHFMSSYDGNEEQEGDYFIYRIN
jgi:hypothetical protein